MNWTGLRVLVTGHTGFKGGWLCLMLKQLGAEVYGFSRDVPTMPSFYEAVGLSRQVGERFGRVDKYDEYADWVSTVEPDVVFHLAGQALVGRAFREPRATFQTNVIGVVNTLEIVRQNTGIRSVVVVTSDKCYDLQTGTDLARREDHPLGGNEPYSCSKACAEMMVSCFRNCYFTDSSACRVASVRAGNVIGGGDWADDRLIPDLVRHTHENRPLFVRDWQSVRPWQAVLEPLWGYMLLAGRLLGDDGQSFAEAWNFGPPATERHSVQEVVSLWAKVTGKAIKADSQHESIPFREEKMLIIDSGKAENRLKWRCRWQLGQGLEKTARWYGAYYQKERMLPLTERMISDYISLQAGNV
ncbi:MAG: CDP-glucose 4,6-dehydratase [Negativicutes bacterium]|nr:CDP-glucose 4,6-dehydratase [Negativicutes bacterium]